MSANEDCQKKPEFFWKRWIETESLTLQREITLTLQKNNSDDPVFTLNIQIA